MLNPSFSTRCGSVGSVSRQSCCPASRRWGIRQEKAGP